MTREAPWVRVELAVLLIGLSLVLPRLAGVGPQAFVADHPQEGDLAAVGYAQHRLWSDFLLARPRGSEHTEPTLDEYRMFLWDRGLRDRGDRASLVVLPKLDAERLSGEVEVRLTHAGSPLVLDVFVADAHGRSRCAGALEIREAGRAITCSSEFQTPRKLLAFWPVRPGPLLP